MITDHKYLKQLQYHINSNHYFNFKVSSFCILFSTDGCKCVGSINESRSQFILFWKTQIHNHVFIFFYKK